MLLNCLEEDVCLLLPECTARRRVWVAKDSKDHSWRIAENSRVSGSENRKKMAKQHLHHHMLFGRVSRNILLAHPKTNSRIFRYQTRQELQMGLASMVRWNKKNSFLAANTQDDLNPIENRKMHRHGAGNLKGLEWFWMKGWLKIWLCCGWNKLLVRLAREEPDWAWFFPKFFSPLEKVFPVTDGVLVPCRCHFWLT